MLDVRENHYLLRTKLQRTQLQRHYHRYSMLGSFRKSVILADQQALFENGGYLKATTTPSEPNQDLSCKAAIVVMLHTSSGRMSPTCPIIIFDSSSETKQESGPFVTWSSGYTTDIPTSHAQRRALRIP